MCCAIRQSPANRFLITIGDRTVGGLNTRDPMVGPWQVPVADCAVTLVDFDRLCGRGDGDRRAHATGGDRRRGRIAHGDRRSDDQYRGADVGAARVKIVRATGWRRAASRGEDAALFDAVRAAA